MGAIRSIPISGVTPSETVGHLRELAEKQSGGGYAGHMD